MTAVRPPVWRRRWFDPIAMAVIGLLVVGTALIPAVTANSGETITIRGDVTADGRRLPFFPVGFWWPGTEDPPATQTDANGRFTLDVPATIDGFAFAGAAPDSDHALVESGGRQVVRGIIGSTAATPFSTPLYQGYTTATGRRLAQGAKQLHFVLQRPGRIAGTSPIPAARLATIQVRRFDGSVVQAVRPDAKGRFRSSSLAPGTYGVVLTPKAPALPVVATVTVASGATATAELGAPPTGAVLTGTIRTAEGAAPAGVPVLLEAAGTLIARTATVAGGRYTLAGLAAGSYSLEVGRYEPQGERPVAAAVPIPGRTSTPTPAVTIAPSPSPSPTSPESAALVPVGRTSDAVLPRSVPVEIGATLGELTADVAVEAAARVSGTVTGGEGAPVQVVIEDPVTGQILRSTTSSAAGDYSFGGLAQGTQYEVWAVSRDPDAALARMGETTAVATAATTGADVVLDRSALTLDGTVAGIAAGSVTAGDDGLLQRTATVDRDGGYLLQGLVPGAYPVDVRSPGRIRSRPVAAVVAEDDSRSLDLQPGPKPATFRGWFISGGAGVPVVSGTATDAAGATVRFGAATDGHVEVDGLPPGDYAYDVDAFQGTVPAVDGPWFFLPPAGTFSLSDGAATDVGPIVLHVRAR